MPQAVSRPSTEPRVRTLNEVIPPIVPMGTTATRLFRRELVRVSSCRREHWRFAQRNSASSLHMRCRMTASLRATATRALAMPRRWATRIPHALSVDHFWQRVSSVCAAS